jgi:hypothetical protein
MWGIVLVNAFNEENIYPNLGLYVPQMKPAYIIAKDSATVSYS